MPNEDPRLNNVGAAIEWCAAQLLSAGVCFGHGTDNAVDEAAALVFHVARLPHDGHAGHYARVLTGMQIARIREILRQRLERRTPLPYLLREAWFAGLKFFVDERVLVPRSPFAELIQRQFDPWLAASRVNRILEIGTGSGCIAIACARNFPASYVVATDVSSRALEVAAVNVARHRLTGRVQLVKADSFAGVTGKFDLIVSNPPYVPVGELQDLPPEFSHEPWVALASGPDGLDSARRILQDARSFLQPMGLLALEVGAGRPALEAAYPTLPFVWPELEHGGEGIGLLTSEELRDAQSQRS